MNTYIVKTMSCDDNKNKDKCIEQMQPSMLNKYADAICRWILYIILKSNSNSKLNTWQDNEV